MGKRETRKLRDNLTREERERLEKFGSVDFQSAGATRKRGGAPVRYSPEGVDGRERNALQLTNRLRKLHGGG